VEVRSRGLPILKHARRRNQGYPEQETDMTSAATSPATPSATPGAFARFAPHVARVLMGALFTFSGLNGFFEFVKPEGKVPERVAAVMAGFMATGYIFKLIFATQLLCGVLFLVNRFVPLAVVLLAPVVVNIFAFHVFVEPSGLVVAIVVLALELFLIWSYRAAYRPMLAARVKPCAA
jgi:hypothetical protein